MTRIARCAPFGGGDQGFLHCLVPRTDTLACLVLLYPLVGERSGERGRAKRVDAALRTHPLPCPSPIKGEGIRHQYFNAAVQCAFACACTLAGSET